MKFNCKLTSAIWSEYVGRWNITIEKTYTDESTESFEEQCVS